VNAPVRHFVKETTTTTTSECNVLVKPKKTVPAHHSEVGYSNYQIGQNLTKLASIQGPFLRSCLKTGPARANKLCHTLLKN